MNGLRARAAGAVDRVWYGDSAWRWALWPLSAAFRSLVALRAGLYRRGMKRSVRLPVPVVVVGNVTVGGTGKTPFVIWLARELAARGRSPGIITRGYGGRASSWPQRVTAESEADEVGDEPVLLAARTACPVYAGPDRVGAAEALLRDAPGVDVLLSDDGLQHYRLARAFEVAVVDGVRGLGNGLCLPAGPLREPGARLATIDAIVVNDGPAGRAGPGSATRATSATSAMSATSAKSATAGAGARSWAAGGRRIGGGPLLSEGTLQVSMTLAVTGVHRLADDAEARLDAFAGRRVHAVAGIGHPERFFRMLEGAGLTVVRHPLPDHARLRPQDLPRDPGVPVLTTEKDAVKLREAARDDVWRVAVEAVVGRADGARLLAAIDAAIEAALAAHSGENAGTVRRP